jgi:hypothetical protein
MKAEFTLFFLAVFLAAAVFGWSWPYIAKLMPVYVAAVPGLVLVLLQIYRDATDWETRQKARSGALDMDEIYGAKVDSKIERQRTLTFFAWLIGGAAGIWLFGIVIALPALVLLYTLVEGKENWITAILMAAGTFLLLWGLFEYMLESRWPSGLLLQ